VILCGCNFFRVESQLGQIAEIKPMIERWTREEAREQHETLYAELVEIKEITRQQAIIAKTQAESIRLMIEMLNRK